MILVQTPSRVHNRDFMTPDAIRGLGSILSYDTVNLVRERFDKIVETLH